MTNGTLITKKFYELSDAFRQKIHKMYVSVDACRPDTYSKIRGTEKQFEDVIKGIRVLVGNGIGVEVLITIQNDNLSDILDSMSLYKSIGVERIVFTNIRNWGAMTAEEFSTAAVHHPGNPRYSEYKSIIDILKKDSFALLFIET
jgi:molybdenum cofactor biosynthesis enzyme MoaA